MSNKYETIVIGLGAAGVTAAVTLAHAGRRVLGLEAQDYIGGRVKTVPFGNGVVELGAEWIHGQKSSKVYETAIQHNIPVVAQDLDMMYFRSNGVKLDQEEQDLFNELVEYSFVVSDSPTEESGPLGDYVTEKIMDYVKSQKPELLQKKEVLNQVLDFTHQLMNNYNASNDWNDLDTKGKYEMLDGHQHLSWHKFGYKKMFDILLNGEMGFPTLDIKLNSEVARVDWPQQCGRVVVSCKDGAQYTANNVIVTVSVGVLKERHKTLFKPGLPLDKINAIENISMGVMDKIDLSFDQIWWPLEADFFGFIWTDEDRKKVGIDELWITKVFAASRPMGAQNVLTMWTSGEVGKMVETLPIELVKEKCIQLLERFMNNNKPIPRPIGIERSTWFSNPYTRGSYSYDSISAAPYPNLRIDLATPIKDSLGNPRILFAGEATHGTRFSTVHGACDTGHREAMRLLPGSSKI